ncbi:MAG: ADP-ribosylation factor-like protein [Candidatus Hodarchaeota archaeon]
MGINAVWVTTEMGHSLFSIKYKTLEIDNTLFGALLATWELDEGEFRTATYANADLGIKKRGSLIFALSFEDLSETEVKTFANVIEDAFMQQFSDIDFKDHMSVFVLPEEHFSGFQTTLEQIISGKGTQPPPKKVIEPPAAQYNHPILKDVVSRMLNQTITPTEAKEKFIEVLGELPSAEEVRRIVNTIKGFLTEEKEVKSSFIKDLSEKIATWGHKAKIFIFGLDFAGKTAITNRFKGMQEGALETISTIRQNVSQVVKQNIILQSWEGAGQKRYRSLWPQFVRNSNALMFVIDGSDPDRFDEAKEELYKLLAYDKGNLPLALCVNKSDLENYIGSDFVIEFLDVKSRLPDRTCKFFNTSALTGIGIAETLTWLVDEIIRNLESFFI